MIVELKRKKSRRRRRWELLGWLVGLVLLAWVADTVHRPVLEWYRQGRQQRALRQAKGFLQQRDFANATLALQVAARASPDNPAAWRVAADALEMGGLSSAIRLREQVLAAQPDSFSDQLALAATALRFHELTAAEDALRTVTPANRERTKYLKIVAALGFAQGRSEAADAALQRILQLEPGNTQMKLNRAVIRLRHADAKVAGAARAELAQLAQAGSPLQLAALRELTRDAGVRSRPAEGAPWAAQLVALPDATFDDAVLQLNLQRLLPPSADTTATEQALARRAAQSSAATASFATWLLVQNRAEEARRWLLTVPATTRQSPEVRAVEADILAALGDWTAVGAALRAGAWGPVAPAITDLALSARTLHVHQRIELRHKVWSECLELAQTDTVTLRVLLRLAHYWQWPEEMEACLLTISRSFPSETWALNALISSAYARRDTAMLKTAYTLYRQAQPSNRRVAGDWAMVTMLQDPSVTETLPRTVARDLHASEPRNPFFTTTYAFALHQQKRTREALLLMDQLTPAELRVPGRALYHGLFLATVGDRRRARECLELAEKATTLPEEKALLQDARSLVQTGQD